MPPCPGLNLSKFYILWQVARIIMKTVLCGQSEANAIAIHPTCRSIARNLAKSAQLVRNNLNHQLLITQKYQVNNCWKGRSFVWLSPIHGKHVSVVEIFSSYILSFVLHLRAMASKMSGSIWVAGEISQMVLSKKFFGNNKIRLQVLWGPQAIKIPRRQAVLEYWNTFKWAEFREILPKRTQDKMKYRVFCS